MPQSKSPPDSSLRVCPVVLAGGPGAQLWPLSRAAYPKQLLRLRGDATLLQDSLARCSSLHGHRVRAAPASPVVSVAPALVACGEAHRYLIADQVQRAGASVRRILLEPAARGTAPALTIAAHAALDDVEGVDPVLLVVPADHVLDASTEWLDAAGRGAALAEAGKIVAFGVVPSRPETAYGYLRQGARVGPHREGFALEAFTEKPCPDAARSFVSAGKYLWNSGIYMVRASVWLDAIAIADEVVAAGCNEAYRRGTADGTFYRVDPERFAALSHESIDYGVMERIVGAPERWRSREGRPIAAAVVPLEVGWSDVGTWPSLLEFSREESEANVVRGDVVAVGTEDCVLVSTSRLLAAVGVEGIIAIETADAVLVAHRDRCYEIPALVEALQAAKRPELDAHTRVYRPWGDYESLDSGERYQVKRLHVKPGEVLSLQMHHHRAEHWVVVRGTAKVTRGEDVFLLTENESTYIPVGMKHRLENPGTVPLEIIEVQSGSYLGEDDIVRFEDRYNRIGSA